MPYPNLVTFGYPGSVQKCPFRGIVVSQAALLSPRDPEFFPFFRNLETRASRTDLEQNQSWFCKAKEVAYDNEFHSCAVDCLGGLCACDRPSLCLSLQPDSR